MPLDVRTLSDPPVVGRRYLVPCVLPAPAGRKAPVWLPVLGGRHNDGELIGFPHDHWHYDWRFMSARILRWCGTTPAAFAAYPPLARVLIVFAELRHEARVMKCVRTMPEWPSTYKDARGRTREARTLFPKLQAAYAHARMKCMTCPHQGLPLNGLPVVDGAVTCVGHGLKWELLTGRLVPPEAS